MVKSMVNSPEFSDFTRVFSPVKVLCKWAPRSPLHFLCMCLNMVELCWVFYGVHAHFSRVSINNMHVTHESRVMTHVTKHNRIKPWDYKQFTKSTTRCAVELISRVQEVVYNTARIRLWSRSSTRSTSKQKNEITNNRLRDSCIWHNTNLSPCT